MGPKGREVLGRFVPAPIWESRPLRFIRRRFVLAMDTAKVWSKRRRETRDARADCDRLLVEHAQYLVEGRWRLHFVRPKVPGRPLRRLQKALQPVLVREDSVSTEDALRACGLDPTAYDVMRGGWSSSVNAAAGALDGWFRPVVVLLRHSSKYLLFDLENGTVLRIAQEGNEEEYERLRSRFSAHVPSVAFEVLPGRDCIVEPLVEGLPFSQVDADVMLRSVVQLFDHLSEMVSEFGEGDSHERMTAAIDSADPSLGAHRARRELVEWLGAAPQVPAHGDLWGANVIVTAEGPVCIDFGATSMQPSWFDGLRIAFDAIRRLEASGDRRSRALDPSLREFLLRVIPADLPDDWRRLAALGARITIGRKIPSSAWIDQRD